MSERCFVCGEDNPNVLHDHHLVPRRYDGDEDDNNIYTLCANCHEAIEKMYNADFYKELGVKEAGPEHPVPETIPAEFIDGYLKPSPSGWVEKQKVRDAYQIFTRHRGLREMPSVSFGRAIVNMDRFDIKSAQRRDPGGESSMLQVYSGVALTEKAEKELAGRR